MEQKRSRLVAPDATGLRARILSTGGLLVVAAMVLVLRARLYPRQQLIERLRAEPRNDELSVSYLANLLSSEPDNDELRILLAERHFALGQTDRTEATLQPMLRKALASEDTRQRLYRLTYRLLEQRANAARPGSPEALALRTQLIEALQARLSMDWTTPQLLEFARKATALEQLGLAQRFHALIRFDSEGDRAPWFEEAVRTALWAQDYTGAATLHLRALPISPTLERQRMHLREAMRILQSGNLLDQALAVAEDHAELVGNDRALLDYLTRLSLAANRPAEAQGYARRLLQMSARPPAAPLRWLARVVDLLVSPAQAAEPVPQAASPAASAAGAPAAGDPRLPFDDGAYLLAFQTFLANRNQSDAWRVAASAVRQAPTNIAWRERLAQVSEWVGKPEEALAHWRSLATLTAGPGGDRTILNRALQAVLRLAPSLNDDEVMLSTWIQVGTMRKLTIEETLGIVALTERLGRPEEGMQWLLDSDLRQPDRRLLDTRAGLAERMGDLPAAIDALRLLIQRDGATVPRAMRLARMHGVRGEHAMAYEALVPLAGKAAETDLDYWRLLANLAWTLQIESQALQALTITTRQGELDPIEADRLLQLLRTRHPQDAARFAEKAWVQLQQPAYLTAALDLWWSARDLQAMERLFGRLDAAAEQAMASDGYFWVLRAQWHQARHEMPAALADMRRALEASPDHIDTRIAYLFMLIDAGAQGELQRMLSTWREQAIANPAYDPAYAAGYLVLEQPNQALPFWRRQVPLHPNDPLWLTGYADVLEAAGKVRSAEQVRRQALVLTRQRLLDPALRAAAPPDLVQSLQLQLARLQLATTQGDGQLRAITTLTGPDGLLADTAVSPANRAAALELVLGWMLSTEQHDQARLWLWRRYGTTLARPDWAEMMLALNDGHLAHISALLDHPDADRLPQGLRIEALQALGHTARAQALRIAQLQLRDDDGQHETYTDTAWRQSRRVEYGLDLGRDAVHANRQSLALWLPLSETMRLRVDAEQSSQRAGLSRSTGTPELGLIAAQDRALSALLQFQPDRALQMEASLGQRSAERSFATGTLSASVQPVSRLTLRADLGFNARATDTAPLAVAGRQQEARLGADLRLTQTTPVRVTLRAAQLDLQSGERLGTALGLDWEIGQVLRGATPDLSVRVFGSYTRYRRTGSALPGWTARLTPDGSQPDAAFFVPDSFALHGVGLSAGLAARDSYTRAWRPFLDLSLTHHSRLGAGYGATVGVAGRLLGSDLLLLQLGTSRSGTGSDARALGLRYVLPF